MIVIKKKVKREGSFFVPHRESGGHPMKGSRSWFKTSVKT